MQLHLDVCGAGPRTAVLVHGATDDHTTWDRVAPHLATRGYQVVAPDLRGHGHTGPAASYAMSDFADDLIENLPTAPDLLVGHSLGALVASLASSQLLPARAVYVDPPWRFTLPPPPEPRDTPRSDGAREAMTLARTDPALAEWIVGPLLRDVRLTIPEQVVAPTLVIEPQDGPLTDPEVRSRLLQRGVKFASLPGVGHVVHRDDPDAFLALLEEWLGSPP